MKEVMSKNSKLPNFLIVGGAKCGTTSLANYLSQNKEIFIPSTKEPHYFVYEKLVQSVSILVRDLDSYHQLFADANEPARGEASVFYLFFHEIVIPRIIETLGADTKIIIILRNPVDRAFSAYNYARSMNRNENLQFLEALEVEDERIHDPKVSPMMLYTKLGKYCKMVSAYQNAFPQCHVELFDDLKSDPAALINRLERFLGVEPSGMSEFQVHNRGGLEWKNPLVGRVMKFVSFHGQFIKKRLPGLRKLAKRSAVNLLQQSAKKITPAEHDLLCNVFSDEIDELEQILGRDLSHWKTANSVSQNDSSPSLKS